MPTHVSIHDVSPLWSREVGEALALCHRAGVRPALLVVPDMHRRAPLLDHPAFAAELRQLQAEGHEIYLHGLHHRGSDARARSGTTRLSWLVAQRVASSGEAEMVGIAPEEAARRLDTGAGVLDAAGLRMDGYVAPAWSMPRWLLPMLRDRGVRYTEDHFRVYDPARGLARPSLVLNWASRSKGRLLSTVAFCRLADGARRLLPARIAIHPADMNHLLLRREIVRALARARGDFVARGAELLA